MTTAYDYDNQCWVEGNDAKILKRQQYSQELELLEGPSGEDYIKFISNGKPTISRQELINNLKNKLKNL
jgi:hypothetical protein